VFFRNENPSDVARSRLVKLTAAVEHIVNEIPKHDAIKDPAWLKDFKAIHKRLAALQSAQQSSKLDKADLGSEVAAQRERWLAVYGANKLLIRGVLPMRASLSSCRSSSTTLRRSIAHPASPTRAPPLPPNLRLLCRPNLLKPTFSAVAVPCFSLRATLFAASDFEVLPATSIVSFQKPSTGALGCICRYDGCNGLLGG
jgi:hypothetical protein